MKADIKLLIWPLIALVLLGAGLMYFNKEKPEETAPAAVVNNVLRDGPNHVKGPESARVTVVEFFDPECEGCAAFHPLLKQITTEYANDVKLVARYMLFHGNSYSAALALEGAGKQGKFWEMYNFMLERQHQWSHRKESVTSIFEGYAKELGLNMEEFNQAYDDLTFKAVLAKDVADGQALGVRGTPTFFINGKMLMNLSYADLKNAIDAELAK